VGESGLVWAGAAAVLIVLILASAVFRSISEFDERFRRCSPKTWVAPVQSAGAVWRAYVLRKWCPFIPRDPAVRVTSQTRAGVSFWRMIRGLGGWPQVRHATRDVLLPARR